MSDIFRTVEDPRGIKVILTKTCYQRHIARRHPDIACFLESFLETVSAPDYVYEDSGETLHYIRRIPDDMARYFTEQTRYFEVPVRRMRQPRSFFWGIATFFTITEDQLSTRREGWKKWRG